MYFCYTYVCLQPLQEWKLVYFPDQTPEHYNLSADCRVTCSIWFNLGNFLLHCSQQFLNENTLCIEQEYIFFQSKDLMSFSSSGSGTAFTVVSIAWARLFPPCLARSQARHSRICFSSYILTCAFFLWNVWKSLLCTAVVPEGSSTTLQDI